MADFSPSLVNSTEDDGLLEHTILVDSISESRASQKASRLAQVKGFSDSQVVAINDSGEEAPPGFTKYEVIVTSLR